MAVDAITNVFTRTDKERKAIKFVSNLKGALMGTVAALSSLGRGEGKGSGGMQRVPPQDYCFLCKVTTLLSCMVSVTANMDDVEFDITC